MSRLLALDQATYTTGYSIFDDNGNIEKISHFTCHEADLGDRLVHFRQVILNLIKQYNIDEVAFEDIQLQDNVITFKMLAEVFGVLHELLNEIEIDYTIVPPNVWKATFKIAGKGRPVEKKMAQQYILNNYQIKCTEDEADSACLGLHLIQKEKNEFDWT